MRIKVNHWLKGKRIQNLKAVGQVVRRPVPSDSGRSRVRVLPSDRHRLSVPLKPCRLQGFFYYYGTMIFYVYIIQSLKDGSFHIESSKDPGTRLVKHNSPHSAYTARTMDYCVYPTLRKPRPSKGFIKKQKSRTFIQKLILEQNND